MSNPVANAVVFEKPNQVSFGTFELPPLREDRVLVETLYTLVSSGTELRVLAGEYGASDRFPLVPGYCVVGRVREVGSEAKGLRVGDLVSAGNPIPLPGINAMWGGQASLHHYPADRCLPLPRGAEALDYLITEVAAISYRGAASAKPQPGEVAVVIGQGLIGAFSAAMLSTMGCRVIAVDRDANRLKRAVRWGVGETVDASQDDALERLRRLAPTGPEIVVEASGSRGGISLAHELIAREHNAPDSGVRPWPRLLLQANYIDTITVNPFSFFRGEGVTLLTPMDRRDRDRAAVIELIRRGDLKSEWFIDQTIPIAEAPSAYARLRDHPGELFSVAYDWGVGPN